MSVHYFHCTDGVSLFADEQGAGVLGDEVFLATMRRAEAVMRGLPSHDWSDWLICAARRKAPAKAALKPRP